ncbi:MAG: hypothetical protein AAGK02_03410 [Pseudomonadota bacterium]
MDQAVANSTRTAPRWWRRFMVASRRANLFLWLEIASAIALMSAIFATYLAFSNAPADSDLLPSMQVSVLLMATLVPAMALLVLVGRRLAISRAAGSTARLHVRLVFFFSLVAAIPTLLVAGFAAFLFQSGVDFWFSDDSRGLIQNANQLAQEYYDQNQREVQDETIAMATDMRDILKTYRRQTKDLLSCTFFRRKPGKSRRAQFYNGLKTAQSEPQLSWT